MMTKKQFEQEFRQTVMPLVADRYERDGIPDKPARREAWNNMVDAYIKDGRLHERAGDWTHPRWLETMRFEARAPRCNPRADIIEGLVALGLTAVGIVGVVMGIRSSRRAGPLVAYPAQPPL